jgi:CheY-like chemotaxis protein
VDDSTYIVDGLVALLKRRGYDPIASHGGDEALAIMNKVKPDLILLDIMMEPMDGWETLERFKGNPETSNIPVLMFSAKKITPEEAKEHSINIEDFVSKPVNPAQLLEAIQRIFARRTAVSSEVSDARDAGHDTIIVDEYAALRKSIEVDTNLLCVLKKSTGMGQVGCEVRADDAAAVQILEEKIKTDEQRLREISGKFVRPE